MARGKDAPDQDQAPEMNPEQKKIVAAITGQNRGDLEAREKRGNVDFNFRYGENQNTPLHAACLHSALDIIDILARNGANASTKNKKGWTPIHVCALKGKDDAVSCLAEYDPNMKVDEVTEFGDTAMSLAAQEGHLPTVNALYDVKAGVNTQNKAGMTALHKAALNGHQKVVSRLLDLRANLNVLSKQSKSALHFACQGGSLPVVKLLVQQGLDPNAVDEDGQSCLHLASGYGNLDIVQYFFNYHGAYVEALNEAGSTPLLVAAQRNHTNVIKELLKRRADPCVTNTEEWSALHKAAYYGSRDAMDILLKTAGVMELIDERTKEGCTPLMLAAQQGHDQAVKLLMGKRADPTIADRVGWMPIHRAAKTGQLACVKSLFTPNTRDVTTTSKRTALMLAASEGRLDTVKFLLSKKCDINLEDAEGVNALRMAFKGDHTAVVDAIAKDQNSGKKYAENVKAKVSKKKQMITTKMVEFETHLGVLVQRQILTDEEGSRIKNERKRTEAIRSMLSLLIMKKNPPQLWAKIFMESLQTSEMKLYEEIMN